MNKRYFLSIIVTIIAIMANTLSMTARPYCDVRKFSIVDGLAANTISDMKQAPDRLMWFGTWNGLSYYDGYSFYTFRDEPGGEDVLSSNRIIAIYPTARNNVWCVTSDRKFYLYSTHHCRFRNTEKSINEQFGINLKVDQLYPIKNGSTWITTKDGNYIIRAVLSQQEEISRELIKVGEHGLRSGRVWHIWCDGKGREWILTEKGTTIYNHHFSTPLPFKWIREVGGNIFLATPDGKLAAFDEREKLIMIPMPEGVTRINQLKNTGYQLLIATNLGLVIYNPRNFKTQLINVQSPSQPMAEVKNIYTDDFGMVWVFTDGMGVTLVNPKTGGKAWLFADQPDPADRNSLPDNNIFDVAVDRHGRIWLATYGGGLVLAKQSATGQISFVSKNNGMPWPKKQFQKVRRIFCSPTGEILVGTTEGLITFGDNFSTPGKMKFFTSQHIDNDSNSISANDIYFIMQHSNGQTLVSELGGALENISSKNLLQNNLQTRIYRHISYDEGIVQSMIEDNQGNLWVVRESSIDRYNPKTGTTEVFGPNDFDKFISFTEARPVHDPATNDITVGTPMGSLTFNPSKMKKSPYQARIIFTMLHYTGESASEPILHKEKVVIPANKRNLSISFASIDYSRKYRTKYRYRIDGHTPEGKWIDLGSKNYIGFNHIASGNYVLKVMGTNSHGVWSKYVAELPIEVRPTFWESIWGKILMVILLMCVVGSIFYIYNRNQREKMSHEMSLMKNDFFSDASHKLRTPLTLIGGPLKEVLNTEHGITRKGREMLTIALKNSYEMLDMLNKILRYDNSTLMNRDGSLTSGDTLVNTGGVSYMDSTENEEDEISGQINDENVARFLAEAEKAEKELEENMTEEEKVAREEQRKEYTVLVVEDNHDLRKYLYTILSEHYNVLLAENGKAGLLMTRTELPDFIITDVTMPVMDGITMVHEIKEDHDLSQIPIIILSAKASVQDRLKGFEMGVDAYMTKPFSTEYLLGRISAVLKQRRNLQKEMIQKLEHTGNLIGKAMSGGISSGINGSKNGGMNNGLDNALNNGLNNALNDGQNGGLIATSANEPEKTLSQITREITEKEREKEEMARLKREQSDFAFMASQINDATTARILKYVTEHIDTPDLKIDNIADAMGMSRSVLYLKIKQQLGMTPIDFVRHVRIMRACELLKNTDESLSSVAFAVGFSDPKYFSKVFKRETGIVPTEYRERTR